MTYDYTAYGLRIRSDAELHGLQQARGLGVFGDVCIFLNARPSWVADACQLPSEIIHSLPAVPECNDPTFFVRKYGDEQAFQLAYGDGTEFFVNKHGEQVWASFAPPLTKEDLMTYLMGPGMGFVLRRRGITPLHASAVQFGETALLFMGSASAGKSTTAAALALRGAPTICEDIAALAERDGAFYVQPGYPRVCLWPDSVEKLLGSEDALPNLTPTWDKKYLGLDGVRAKFESRALPIATVYLLAARAEEEAAPRIEEMPSREALMELVANTYMNQLLTREQRAAEFEWLSRLVNRVQVKRLVPHRDAARIEMLCEIIENDAASKNTAASAKSRD